MHSITERLPSARALRGVLLALLAAAASSTPAATVWTGSATNYNQPGTDPTQPANQDRLTSNIWLTRAGSQGLFNARTEAFFTHFVSPADTEWANGTTANYSSLSYTDWNTWSKIVNGGPPSTVGVDAVLHLISEDIYLDIKFTFWGGAGGGFAYQRSTPQAGPPTPTVNITSPTNGATFIAPATFQIDAAATVTSGSVTNVSFFANGSPLGSDQSNPFSIGSGGLPAGAYGLTAVATAAGISSTSAVVNISVLAPGAIILSSPKITAGQFSFDYTANVGLNYVVENSSNLLNWLPLSTNTASSNLVHFTNGVVPGGTRHYRVGQVIP